MKKVKGKRRIKHKGGVLKEENMSSEVGDILFWDQSEASVRSFLYHVL